jgi:capsular exopolysaccharide synthesis family protein
VINNQECNFPEPELNEAYHQSRQLIRLCVRVLMCNYDIQVPYGDRGMHLYKIGGTAMDLSKFLNIVYRYLWLLGLAALVAGLTTFFQLSSRPGTYKATTDLLVGPSLDSPSPDLNSLKIGGQLAQTYAEVVDTRTFLESVNNKLDQKIDLAEMREAISTRQSAETRVLSITVYHPDPNQAVAIANAAAQTLIDMSPSKDNTTSLLRSQMSDQSHQLEQIVSKTQISIEQLEAELLALKDVKTSNPETVQANLEQQNLVIKQLADERSRLSEALRTLATVYQVLLDTNTNQVQIIEPATSVVAVDKQILLRVASSAIGGLIFAIILIFVVEYFDDKIRFPRDLSKAAGAPLLSTIGKHDRLNGSGLERLVTFARPDSDAANSYREVVAKLLFSIGETTPHTFLLSSVGSHAGDDTAVAAGNLAVAFAQAGYKVVLVDAQVHNSSALTNVFKADKKEGVAELVVTKSTNPQLLPVEQVSGLRFLPAGSSSEKSSRAMLNSSAIATLFEELQKEADIVLVAGSPISKFAESLTLASQVNGIVLVARSAEAISKTVSRVVENLRLMDMNLAGVIFDYNPSPFISKDDQRIVSATGRVPSEETVTKSSLSEQTTES